MTALATHLVCSRCGRESRRQYAPIAAYNELEAENERLRGRCDEAERLLLAAYQDAHSEDVPMVVLDWLNPHEPALQGSQPETEA